MGGVPHYLTAHQNWSFITLFGQTWPSTPTPREAIGGTAFLVLGMNCCFELVVYSTYCLLNGKVRTACWDMVMDRLLTHSSHPRACRPKKDCSCVC
jgi:hypothetical protein